MNKQAGSCNFITLSVCDDVLHHSSEDERDGHLSPRRVGVTLSRFLVDLPSGWLENQSSVKAAALHIIMYSIP